MTDKRQLKRLHIGSYITLKALENMLDSKSIPSLLKDNVESARLGGFGASDSSNELFVFEANFKQATEILKEFLSQTL